MLNPAHNLRGSFAAYSLSALVLFVGVVLSTHLAKNRSHLARQQAQYDLQITTRKVTDTIENRFLSYELLLRAVEGLLKADDEVTREEWRVFADILGVGTTPDGTLGLALVRAVPKAELRDYETLIRESGVPDFTVHAPASAAEEPPLDTHFVIELHEPAEVNRMVWGLDVSSIPVNNEAYQLARDTGQVWMTPAFRLAQQREDELGVVLVLPIYSGEGTPATVEDRRQRIDAFIALSISVEPLFGEQALLHRQDADLRFDGLDDQGRWITLFENPGHVPKPDELTARATPVIPGPRWSVIAAEHDYGTQGWLAGLDRELVGGLMISFLLAVLVRLWTRTRANAERLAGKMTQSLRESEARYRALVDGAPVCIKELDDQGRIISMNPAGLSMLGLESESDIVGQLMDDLVVPEDVPLIRREHARVLANETRSFQFRLPLDSGEIVVMETLVVPRPCKDAEVTCMICVTQNVTERVRAENEIRENEARLDGLTRLAPIGIFRADRAGTVVDASERLTELTGLSLAQACQDDWSPYIHPDDYPDVVERWDRMVAEYVNFNSEYRLRRQDGTWAWFHVQAVPDRNEHGSVTGFVGSMADHTERRAVEDQLRLNEARMRDLAEQAQAANRIKGEFLANMSHEIRTPMAAILGFAELLDSSVEPGSQAQDALQTIQRNGEHLLQIINDVLNISKIEAGKLTVSHVDLDLPGMVDQIFGLLGHKAQARGTTLVPQPSEDAPTIIVTDPVRLRQVLLNLVGNAIKFTRDGTIRVITSRGDTPGSVVIEVIDTGTGLNPDRIEQIFEPFVQGDSTTTRTHGGTGLGLSISRKIAEALGGTLTADPHHRGGSRFVLTLNNTAPNENATPEPAASPPLRAIDDHPCRVLLAEDSVDSQRLIAHHLRHAGHEVVTADDGAAAVDLALAAIGHNEPFDLILMDMQMPKLDGYGATARLRTRGYTGRIVALTAHAMDFEMQRCLDAGCDEYATKPIPRQTLLDLVHPARRAA
ncbi:MAG: PAS domain S-box-containing protein [Phycisphaerales bacterium]|jgi:PAS domain S-box-containing protein